MMASDCHRLHMITSDYIWWPLMIESDDWIWWLPLIASDCLCCGLFWLHLVAFYGLAWLLLMTSNCLRSPLSTPERTRTITNYSVNSKNCPDISGSSLIWLVQTTFDWSVPAHHGLVQPAGSDRFGLVQTSNSGLNQPELVWTSRVVQTTLDWFRPDFLVGTRKKWYKPSKWFEPHRWSKPLFLVQTGKSGINQPKWCEPRSRFVPLFSGLNQ